jgi:hypothetical protein
MDVWDGLKHHSQKWCPRCNHATLKLVELDEDYGGRLPAIPEGDLLDDVEFDILVALRSLPPGHWARVHVIAGQVGMDPALLGEKAKHLSEEKRLLDRRLRDSGAGYAYRLSELGRRRYFPG